MATLVQPAGYAGAPQMAIGKILRAYLLEAKYETLQGLRTPAMAVPFLVIPLAVYLLFGVVITSDEPDPRFGERIVDYMFASFCTFAVLMPGVFSGVALALERDGGLLKLKRAQPMPVGANLVAKAVCAVMFGAAALLLVVAANLVVGRITLTGSQVAIIAAAVTIAQLPICAIGFFIGSVTSGRAAPAYSNLLFLPMMWLSGLFIPLPEFLQPWVVIWPAFHVNQLALGLAGVDEFSFFPPELAAGVLVGITVVFGGVAIWRLARKG